MLSAACVLMTVGIVLADGGHAANRLYQQLLRGELAPAAGDAALPEPHVVDGLDGAAQTALLDKIPGRRLPVGELTRDAVNAPFVLSVRDIAGEDGSVPLRAVDLWFVAYGSLDHVSPEGKTGTLTPQKQENANLLTQAELADRGIEFDPAATSDEGYSHGVASLLERVELQTTTHYQISRSPDSLVIASTLDPRFADDRRYPNQWRDLEILPDGGRKLGPPQPYRVSAMYMKVTRLETPAGALFVEFHTLLEHPPGWFGGRDLLRSKIPLAVQGVVRDFRYTLKKAAKDKP